ncbi:indole-3-acetaldehyde dehydrogenase [Auriscalpium vulgare]|uniref:Indole-3-acetaldehyde dehydrogenase n=1 Tax=Auriscalpium vulgare TaxID=40419 RepID=A0ACB8RDN0_9AGAM|nr:indole-3-acetaldehyde dehydrogenase [Auriscalpium vulgare]
MSTTFTYEFDTEAYKGKVSFPTGIFIDGQFSAGSEGKTIDIVDPTNGRVLTTVAEGTAADVDRAVVAAKRAYDSVWGLKTPGYQRGVFLARLADLMEAHIDELSALEALDAGKPFLWAKNIDVTGAIATIRYYAGWADKMHGKVIETTEDKLAYTRHEPFGVVGQIIPWNVPLVMMAFKLGPALATGNALVLKPSEVTPLTALRMCSLINEAGFPPGTANIVVGYGNTVGQAISEHMGIDKIAFTGSTLVGRKVMEAAAKSNLKNVTLELGGKSPNIIFDDADLDAAVQWTSYGIFWNQGQACCAGTRIFVQEGIYDQFLKAFTEKARSLKLGHTFELETYQGPLISDIQFTRVMSYIECGKQEGANVHLGGERHGEAGYWVQPTIKQEGATVHLGGERHGEAGYWVQPTIFTDTTPDMRIVREEIFGPVGVLIKFKDEDDVLRQANDTLYGLAAAVFTPDVSRALRVAHTLQAGTVWVNCINMVHANVPFGGYKQSGIGREQGEYALDNYTNVKAVHVNLGHTV